MIFKHFAYNQINKLKTKLEIIQKKYKQKLVMKLNFESFDSHGRLKSYKLPFQEVKKNIKLNYLQEKTW